MKTYSQLRKEQNRARRENLAFRAACWIILAFFIGCMIVIMANAAHATESDRLQKFSVLASYAAIDYSQSADLFYHRSGYYEINPILGKQPSRRDMLAFGAVGMALLYFSTKILPDSWSNVLIDSAISSEGWNIEDNVLVSNAYHRRINAVPVIVTLRW